MRLRVLTLNVWNDQGDPRRTELINRELHRLAPDLIAFQEVLHTPDRQQLDELLAGMGYERTHHMEVMAAPPDEDRRDGIAVASRWPHRVVEALEMCLAVTVPLPDVGDVLFISATTPWRLDDEYAREQQAVRLSELDARHRTALPTIIAGDFNATPDASSIRFLCGLQSLDGRSVHYHDAWAIAGAGPGYTWNRDNPNARSEIERLVRQPHHRRRIDYIFVGSWHVHPHAYCQVRAATLAFDEPMAGVWPSDHFGVIADLEIGRDG